MGTLIVINVLVHTMIAISLLVLSFLGVIYGVFKYMAMKKRVVARGLVTQSKAFKSYSYEFIHPVKGSKIIVVKKSLFSWLYKQGSIIKIRVNPKKTNMEIDTWHSNGLSVIILSILFGILSIIGLVILF